GPVLHHGPHTAPIVTEVFAKLSADSVFSWQALAETPRANTLNRKWFISDQLAILKVLAGLSFLMNYPHGCTEQKVSYAYPSLSYDEIWQQMGLESPDPRLKEFINQTLEFLQSAQIPDGLFGYWPGSKGYVYLTAYITEFLLAVQKANQTAGTGYRLDETMLTRALGALRRAVRSDYPQFLSGYKYYERCAALYALALAGRAETTYLRELAVQTTQVDLISQARILKAIHTSQVNLGDLTDGLENRLWNETLFRLQRGQEVFAGLQQRSMRIGAEVHATEITNLAGLVSAFAVTDRNPEKLQMMVDELVTLGSAGGWGQTNVNSQALLALRDFIAEARKSEVTAEFGLSTGAGLRTLNYDGRKAVLQYASKDAGAGRLRLQENPGNRQFYVRFSQSYLPQAFGHAAAARQRGFVVKRELIRVSQTEAPDSKVAIEQPNTTQTFAIADVLEEHIQVVNPTDRHFVAVSAPFAAGFEPLNPNLATASSEANPNGQTTERVDYQAFLDDRVVYYFDFLPSGTYDFYFRLRATTAGVFTHPPAEAEMMYEQKVTGSSPGVKIIVGRAQ
ncbi:MAG: hypothetical protein ACE5FD_12920, partial [Anaerolineae bacterium]